MKLLTVSALLCAVMALTTAAENHEVVKRPSACPCGWTEFNGQCYMYEHIPMTYAEAQKNCQSMGANLASVHSDEEYKHLQRIVFKATHRNGRTWLGGSDSLQEGLWYWSDGTAFDYVKWCSGQPDDYQGKQDCLIMNWGGNGCYSWDDFYCEFKVPSICTKRIR